MRLMFTRMSCLPVFGRSLEPHWWVHAGVFWIQAESAIVRSSESILEQKTVRKMLIPLIAWPSGAARIRLIRSNCGEFELGFTVRESRLRGSGASLDVPGSSMPAKTLLPEA